MADASILFPNTGDFVQISIVTCKYFWASMSILCLFFVNHFLRSYLFSAFFMFYYFAYMQLPSMLFHYIFLG